MLSWVGMRVTSIQFKAAKGDLRSSRERLGHLADEASRSSDLVVLPEMAASGYLFDHADAALAVSETADGPTFRMLSRVAASAGCWIVAGYPEVDGDKLYNSALVIDPGGSLAFNYRKTLLYDADMLWARPGNSGYRAFSTPHGRFGVGICMDINDPRFVLWCFRARLDVIAFPTNWVDEGMDVWGYWRDRIAGTGSTLIAANTYGRERDVPFSGQSAILDRRRVFAAAPRVGDCVVRAELRLGRHVDAPLLQRAAGS